VSKTPYTVILIMT